jgi:DNA polymerase V
VTEQHHLAEAVTELASRAAEKLHKQHSLGVQVLVFIRTSPFRKDPQYSRSVVIPLRRHRADTACLVKATLLSPRHIFQQGFLDAKAGVMLLDFQPDTQMQTEFDLDDYDASEDCTRLMHAMDTLNQRFGKGSVLTASPDWRGYLSKGP